MAASMVQRNLPYLKEQVSAALGNSSVVVKFVCIALTISYFFSFSDSALRFLTVTPGYVLPPNFWVWTYFTFSFIEVHIWNVLIDLFVMVLYGKLLEPLWGALEMLIFFAVVNVGVALATTFVYIGIYLITQNTDYLFVIHIHGLAGYLAGFAVATKQVMPDHILINSPFGKLRNRHIPLSLLYLAVIVRLIGGVEGPFPIMFGNGLFISWVYLRFYQKHNNGNRGDMADSFTFVSFFPYALQPVLGIVSNAFFTILVKIKLCKKPTRRYDVSAPTTITVSLPGTDPQDAERRRQLALKALNERLSKVDSPTSWPSLDEESSESAPPGAKEDTKSIPVSSEKKDTPQALPPLPVPDFKEAAKSATS